MTDQPAEDSPALRYHQHPKPGKLEIRATKPLENGRDLARAYSPGVAEASSAIHADPARARDFTARGNLVAVVSNGSAVLGLGNIGALASKPVMEGKAVLFKKFAGIDCFDIELDEADPEKLADIVCALEPTFGAINLEDIKAPDCFIVEKLCRERMNIPVFHDDQHGTAIVLLAGLLNAAKVVGRPIEEMRVVISGAGAAGTSIARLLRCVHQDPSVCVPVRDVIVCDSKGAIHARRTDLNHEKTGLLAYTNRESRAGSLKDVLVGADVFVGVSKGGLLDADDVRTMAADPIILAMANPVPEIMPGEAVAAGAAVVGTGRSDFPNQVNNVLAFPGIFRGALDARAPRITPAMKLAAAHALADAVGDPSPERILPDPLDKSVAPIVAQAVRDAAEG